MAQWMLEMEAAGKKYRTVVKVPRTNCAKQVAEMVFTKLAPTIGHVTTARLIFRRMSEGVRLCPLTVRSYTDGKWAPVISLLES